MCRNMHLQPNHRWQLLTMACTTHVFTHACAACEYCLLCTMHQLHTLQLRKADRVWSHSCVVSVANLHLSCWCYAVVICRDGLHFIFLQTVHWQSWSWNMPRDVSIDSANHHTLDSRIWCCECTYTSSVTATAYCAFRMFASCWCDLMTNHIPSRNPWLWRNLPEVVWLLQLWD